MTRPAPVLPQPTLAPPASDLRGVARGGLANLAGAAVAGLAGFAVTWLVARGLGKESAGGFFAGTAAFVMVGMLAKLGTQTSLVYFLARLRASGATVAAMRRCVRTGLLPVTVAAVLTGALMFVFARPLANLTAHGDADRSYVAQLRVLAIFLPLGVLSDTILAATRGLRAMRPTVVLDKVLRPCLQVVALAVLILLASRRASGYAAAWVAPYLLSAVLAAVSLRDRLPAGEGTASEGTASEGTAAKDDKRPPGSISAVAFWRFTAPRAVASVAQLALNRFDVLLLGALAGLKAAAVYAVAGRFIVLGQFANQAINQSVQPRIAERLAVGDRDGANRLYQTSTGWLVLAVWPLYFGIAVYAKVYLSLFGPGYAKAADVVIVLAGAMLVASGCGMVDIVLAMGGRTSWNLANVVTAVAVNVGVDLLLIPRYGAIGAAVGLACALLANNLIPLAQISAVLGLHPFGRATLLSGALAASCFGLLPVLLVAVVGVNVWSAVAGAALGGALYLGAISRLRTALNIDAFLALRRAGRDGRNEGGA